MVFVINTKCHTIHFNTNYTSTMTTAHGPITGENVTRVAGADPGEGRQALSKPPAH